MTTDARPRTFTHRVNGQTGADCLVQAAVRVAQEIRGHLNFWPKDRPELPGDTGIGKEFRIDTPDGILTGMVTLFRRQHGDDVVISVGDPQHKISLADSTLKLHQAFEGCRIEQSLQTNCGCEFRITIHNRTGPLKDIPEPT